VADIKKKDVNTKGEIYLNWRKQDETLAANGVGLL
jgi:hypothetical protein